MGTTNFAARNDSRAHARACPDMLIHAHEGKKIWNRQKETPEGRGFVRKFSPFGFCNRPE